MDDRELEKQLKSLNAPPPRPEQVEQALALACRAFDDAQTPSTSNRKSRPIVVIWGVLGLAAAIALAVLLIRDDSESKRFSGQPPRAGHFSADDWRRIVSEMQGLFPERLQAVVASGGELDVRLHREPQRVSDQPILVALQTPDGAGIELVSFSGEALETQVADSRVSLELFLTASGDVLLTGDHFFWTRRDSVGLDTLSIRAWSLENGS